VKPPVKKIDVLRRYMVEGEYRAALRMAANFPRLPAKERNTIRTAWAACSNPNLYDQMGKDPATLVQAGVQALRRVYETQAMAYARGLRDGAALDALLHPLRNLHA